MANEDDRDVTGPAAESPPADVEDGTTGSDSGGPLLALRPEDYPDVSDLVTEDGKPADSIYVDKQYRLLTEPLDHCWEGPGEGQPWVSLTNVGLFGAVRQPPLVPDFLLSLGVDFPEDLRDKNHRSYFVWVFGKFPDVVIEIVSDRRGGEETHKMREYARKGIPYYVIYDPEDLLVLQRYARFPKNLEFRTLPHGLLTRRLP